MKKERPKTRGEKRKRTSCSLSVLKGGHLLRFAVATFFTVSQIALAPVGPLPTLPPLSRISLLSCSRQALDLLHGPVSRARLAEADNLFVLKSQE